MSLFFCLFVLEVCVYVSMDSHITNELEGKIALNVWTEERVDFYFSYKSVIKDNKREYSNYSR